MINLRSVPTGTLNGAPGQRVETLCSDGGDLCAFGGREAMEGVA